MRRRPPAIALAAAWALAGLTGCSPSRLPPLLDDQEFWRLTTALSEPVFRWWAISLVPTRGAASRS